MAARKVLTRAESQALTREELIEAAERLFYADGYHATSLAAIAAEAGRTIGAVYSNFDSKEALCLEVLRSWATARMSRLANSIAATDGSLEQRLDAIATWWDRELVNDNAPLILAAEYGISVLRDPAQQARAVEACERLVDSGRVLILDHLPESAAEAGQLLEDGVHGVLAAGIGLAAGGVTGLTPPGRSSSILTATIEFWLQRLGAAVGGASAG
ncbi:MULTISPECIES: TetR/AcrR family transcriptional regulator [unclassified Nocardia]|uniref:TetR/AcrR family transcriptional regulator n=1 Tax=unclassified Nocardia TaxID=2637762 RepID=UPI0035DE0A4C